MKKELETKALEMGISYEALQEAISCFAPCMNDYLYVYDLDNDLYCISEKAMERFNVPSPVFSNVVESHRNFVYESDLPMLQYDLDEMVAGIKDTHDLNYRWLGKDGEPIWINCKGRVIRGKSNYMVGCINEIGAKQTADNLTGLLGEKSFRDGFEGKDRVSAGYVLRVGIDDFKQITENLGMEYGDRVLRELSDCIRNSISKKQMAFRMQADEFLIVDETGGSEIDAIMLFRKIREMIDDCLMKKNYEVVYTISAGIVTSSHVEMENVNKPDYDWIAKRSQFALNQAKINGKNQFYVYSKEAYERFVRDQRLLVSVRKAINNNFKGFELHFQPIVSTGMEAKVIGAEALLRFKTEKGEWVSPVELVPILESSGLIIPVGKWIMKEAFAMCKRCQEYLPGFRVSVNISYVQLNKSPVYKSIIQAIEKEQLPANCVVVEMTESGSLDNGNLQDVWRNLKEYGCRIAIDDFGTGYSNLHSISELKPDLVKIDRSFTMKALHNDYENELMEYIVRMVHSINANLIIEGIETADELEKICQLNPDYIQGYYYSKPISRLEFEQKFIAAS